MLNFQKVEKMSIKNKIIIIVMLLGSALFLYQGFSLLFHPEDNQVDKYKDKNSSD